MAQAQVAAAAATRKVKDLLTTNLTDLSVSYTHLDVYKRQLLDIGFITNFSPYCLFHEITELCRPTLTVT